MGFAWRPLTVADTPAWSRLTRVLAEYDGTSEVFSADDLVEELAFPDVDPELDTAAVVDVRTGELVGFGQVFFRDALVDGHAAADTSGGVHPAYRGRGLGTELLRRLEDRAATALAERFPGTGAVIRADAGVQVGEARELLADRGFAEARFFHVMAHDLTGLLGSESDLGAEPLSLDLRAYDPATDEDAVRLAHTVAFATHWRSAPWSEREWRVRVPGSRAFRPELSYVRPGTDGSIEGYALSFEYEPGELYVGLLGVRPHGRGRGTGTALLRMVLTAALAAGLDRARLDVDSDNGTGAGRLYEAVGFRAVSSTVATLKTLVPHPG